MIVMFSTLTLYMYSITIFMLFSTLTLYMVTLFDETCIISYLDIYFKIFTIHTSCTNQYDNRLCETEL